MRKRGRPALSDIPTCPGVYRIVNSENGMVYLGSCSDLRDRWSTHRSSLRGGYHSNKSLHSDYTTYGLQAFHFEVIQEFETYEEANFYEKQLIQDFEDKELLYNIAITGKPTAQRNVPKSIEHKQALSQSMKGKNRGPKTDEHKRAIGDAMKRSWALRKAV